MGRGKVIAGFVATAVLFFLIGWFGRMEYLRYELREALGGESESLAVPAETRPPAVPSPADTTAVGNATPSVGQIFQIGDLKIKTVKVVTGARSERGTWDTVVTTQGQLIVAYFKAKNVGKSPSDIGATGIPTAKLVTGDGTTFEPKGWTMPGEQNLNPGVTENNIRVVWDVAKEIRPSEINIDVDGSVIAVQVG
ncbi:hypothetical protein Ssi03_34070 [Sphaerisporangium siamense]|uniref:DUF4352 domain-containing protein n=1 Tax=Sphaerisporangium siamense TaxID=795645 RepID=A0A7W7D1G6_9ACTN|nr:hypothetical protein [Sphaerisporangium siamense]MBB4698522.1 hypothetical protein [Sphaerisporangium siamense]GII85417.1 hypothetical protein Ssi03_34070 [Sphaerisporangium siamense]